jgi:putative aldouronate transport system permease protein
MNKVVQSNIRPSNRSKFGKIIRKDFMKNKELYLLVIPVILYYFIFHYKPMYGAIIAFKNFVPAKGIIGSPWVGLKHFKDFFGNYYFGRLLRNTITISGTSIIFGFPAPIILALLINELKVRWFSRIVQTITYLPHFISLVVICGMIRDFSSDRGVLTSILSIFTGKHDALLNFPNYFVPLFVGTDIWQGVGWGSIIYLAALMGIDQELYEAASIDGAGRWRQTIHITLPGILPTIVIMLILRLGGILNVGFEKIILLYNPVIYEKADVISSFVYRKGLQEFNFSYSSAVGLFNSAINFFFVVSANWISRKLNETSLW